MRNHNTLTRPQIIQEVAKCVPPEHKVVLENPDVFILIEIFKVSPQLSFDGRQLINAIVNQSVCGISVVKDYYRLQKFNVIELANAKNLDESTDGTQRVVVGKPDTPPISLDTKEQSILATETQS